MSRVFPRPKYTQHTFIKSMKLVFVQRSYNELQSLRDFMKWNSIAMSKRVGDERENAMNVESYYLAYSLCEDNCV